MPAEVLQPLLTAIHCCTGLESLTLRFNANFTEPSREGLLDFDEQTQVASNPWDSAIEVLRNLPLCVTRVIFALRGYGSELYFGNGSRETATYVDHIPHLHVVEEVLCSKATAGNLRSVIFRADDDFGRRVITSADWYLLHLFKRDLCRLKERYLLQVLYPE